MPDIEEVYSYSIRRSMIDSWINRLFETIVRLFFRRLEFDKESLHNIETAKTAGNVVFVSFQSSATSLLLFVSLLRKHSFALPGLALGFSPYPLQRISSAIKSFGGMVARIFRRSSHPYVDDVEYLKRVVQNDDPLVFSLLSERLFRKRFLGIKADTLQALVEIQAGMDEPILLMPQIMFWNNNPEKTRTLMTSKATGDKNIWMAILTSLKSVTPPFIRIGQPVNIKELMAQWGSDDTENVARKLRAHLLEGYHLEKRSVLGPVLKSQQEMIERVLYHQNVMSTINEIHEKDGRSVKRLRRQAYRYYREIAADFSIMYIKFFDRALDYIFSKIFDGIHVDTEDFRRIRDASQKAPLIIVPSHKSHIDYLVVSSQFYKHKLIPPHIVAGANLTFFPMGHIFRRSGAFFMRRSFKGLPLYAAVFRQYIKMLVNEGYSIEFFIEGGRTRTGKLVAPKMGVLKYLMDAVDEGYNKDLVFVPASISYDRIMEETSYHKEFKGKEKKTESTSGFMKSRKLLKRKYGRVYLNFGEPVSYTEMLKQCNNEEDKTSFLGYEIVRRINRVGQVTPFALTTAAILISSTKGFSRQVLRENIERLLHYLKYIDAPLSGSLRSDDNLDDIIEYVLSSYKEDSIVVDLAEGGDDPAHLTVEGIYSLNEDDRGRINFYMNSMIHFLLPVSYTALALLSHKGKGSTSALEKRVRALKEFYSEEFIYSDLLTRCDEAVDHSIQYFASEGLVEKSDNGIKIQENGRDTLVQLGRVIQDYLESYLIVIETLLEEAPSGMNHKDLTMAIRKKGIAMYHLGDVKLAESLSMMYYNNALKHVEAREAISVTGNRKKQQVTLENGALLEEMKTGLLSYLKILR